MLRHYLVLATKVLLRRKFFTFISLFGIAFTLVVLVVVTAFMDHLLGPAAPETRQNRTLGVEFAMMYAGRGARQGIHRSRPGFKLLDRYARDLPGVERLSLFSAADSVALYVDGQKVVLSRKRTDGEFWQALDFTFLEGRPYTTREANEAAFLAVISRRTRQRLLGDRPLEAATIEVDGQRFQVIGVVPDISAMRTVPFADVWVPITTAKTPAYRDDLMGGFQAIAVATDRAAMAGIHDEFNARLSRAELPEGFDGIVAPFETKFQSLARMLDMGDDRDPESHAPRLIALMTTVGLMFALLPTVNLVNINVSRILERASEIGVRKAFGASSRTLVVQFVVENVLLTLAGAAVAFVGSAVVLDAINRSGVSANLELALNLRVFLWGAGLAVAFGVFSGVYPAWRMSRLRPVEALKGVTR